MARACQNVGTTAYSTNSLAVALTVPFWVPDIQAGGCFKCGSIGQFERDCPQQGDGIKVPLKIVQGAEGESIGLLTAVPNTLSKKRLHSRETSVRG